MEAWFILPLLLSCFSIFNPFYFDDYAVLRDNAWLRGSSPWVWWIQPFLDSNHVFPGFRPILMTSFWFDRVLFGTSAPVHRMGNILLHVFNGYLLYRFLLECLPKKFRDLCIWIALIFSLHPIQTLGINFVWKRSTLLESFFIFFGVLCHLRWRPAQGLISSRLWVFHILMGFLAMGTKESGVLYPFWVGLVDLVTFGRGAWRQRIGFFGTLMLIAVGFAMFRLVVVESWMPEGRVVLQDWRSKGMRDYFLWSLGEVPRMWSFLLLPAPRIIEDPSYSMGIVHRGAWGALGILACLVFAGIRWKRNPLFWAVVSILIVPMLPTNSIFPLYFVSDSIRLYVPCVAWSILMMFAMDAWSARFHFRRLFATTAFVILYAFLFAHQNLRYRSPQEIWQDVLDAYPHSGIAWGELGGTLQNQGRHGESAMAFLMAAKNETHRPGYMIRALGEMLESGTEKSQIKEMATSIKMENMGVSDVVNLATLFAKLGETERAERLLRYALEKNPSYAGAKERLDRIGKKR